jgi:hypothetical protein
MTTIYQYFTDKLGAAPADDTCGNYRSTAELPAGPPEAPTSGIGTFRAWRDVRVESGKRRKADIMLA